MSPGYGTASVALATTPAIVSTFFTHIATWPQRHIKSRTAESTSEREAPTSVDSLPGQQLRYEEGLYVVRGFLNYASTHGVEEVQDFTAQPVPVPHWVRKDVVTIPDNVIDRAAEILTKHLASYGDGKGIELIGGEKWWRIRGRELEAEWIEMSKDYATRTAQTALLVKADKRRSWAHLMGMGRPKAVRDGAGGDVQGDRVILYIHGGAFFFASTDLHRYQIQRHARKAGARAFVPNYRLAPQYPFPCGLLDSLASYLYLIDPPEGITPIAPSNIILMGDSAGGGMCLSMLQLIREMGLPMPAAASLMSPWVDLTHSMPSIMKWDGGDYIPSVGFHYKPSAAWPPSPGDGITVEMDGKDRVLDEQVQLYCPNKLLTHPLVSPINAGSFGGLCPLYISAGSVELLRDEIIYFAHKVADPTAYPPADDTLKEYPEQAALVSKYPPTKVHLQVFEGACHVATTLAWTRSAKHIFRGTANFNIWAFNEARKAAAPEQAPKTSPGLSDADAVVMQPKRATTTFNPGWLSASSRTTSQEHVKQLVHSRPTSVIASRPTSGIPSAATSEADHESESSTDSEAEQGHALGLNYIKVRGHEPPFGKSTMVAERVSTHGRITVMEPVEKIPALDPIWAPRVGRIRGDGPVHTWLKKRAEWDEKYGVQLKHWRSVRIENRKKAEANGFLTGTLQGENPPLCALVSLSDRTLARDVGRSVDEPTTATSTGVALWMKIGEKADEDAVEGKHHHHKRNSSWVTKLGRRASLQFGRDKTHGEKRHSGEKGEKRKSGGRKSGDAAAASPESSKDAQEARRTSFSTGAAKTPSLPSSPNAQAKAPSTPTSPRRGPPPALLLPASPPTSADPVADALTKLTVHGTPDSVVPTPLPVPDTPTSVSGTGTSVMDDSASTSSYTTAESESDASGVLVVPPTPLTAGRSSHLSPVMEKERELDAEEEKEGHGGRLAA